MDTIIQNARYQNVKIRLPVNALGSLILSSLYFWGFYEAGTSAIGHWHTIFYAFHLFLGLSRLLLYSQHHRLSQPRLVNAFYTLMTFSTLVWVTPSLMIFIEHGHTPHLSPHEFIKYHFFVLIGVLNSLPQFFRHAKWPFLLNEGLLFIGLLFLIPAYFTSNTAAISGNLIVILFFATVMPQFVRNWQGEIDKIRQERELQKILDAVPSIIIEVKHNKYVRTNQYAKDHLCQHPDYQNKTIIGEELSLIHGDQNWVKDLYAFTQSGLSTTPLSEHIVRTKEGPRTHLVSCSRLDIEHIVATLIDIEDQLQARKEADLQRAQAQDKARLAGLGLMASGIAHEINNPLAVIQTRTDMAKKLLNQPTPDPIKILAHIEKVGPMVKRINRIIQTMRNLARDTSQDEFDLASVTEMIEDVLLLAEEKTKTHNIKLIRDYQIDPGLQIACRPTEIGQVIINALNNSIQAIADINEPWIKIQTHQHEDHLIIQIQDAGAGIPEQFRDKLMTPLFTTKAPGEGTGLGLALSRQIMATHQGQIEFDHQQANTTLVIRLPLQSSKNHQAAS